MAESDGNAASGQVSGQLIQARDIHGDVHLHMDEAPRRHGPPDDPVLARLRDAYLRWVADRHRWAEAPIAGRRIRAPMAGVPARESLVSDGSTPFARAVEVEHLGSRARDLDGEGDAPRHAVLAAQPLPTYLTPPGRVDRLDLATGERVAADELLAATWRSVVLGDPGGGKSTLARRLARMAAERAPGTAPPPASDRPPAENPPAASEAPGGPASEAGVWRLPVLCRAGDLVRGLDDRSGAEAGLAATAIAAGWDAVPPFDPASRDTIPRADLHRLVRWHAERDGLLLIVDGLDEVATLDERAALAGALDAFAGGVRLDRPDRAPGTQLLVTSRVMGYHAAPLGERFDQLLLAPMAPDAAEEIGRFWVAAYTEDAGIGPAAGEAFRAELDRRLASPRIAELAANPYLLVSLASAVVSGTLQEHRGAGDRWLRCDLYQVMLDDAVRRAAAQFPHAGADFLRDLHTGLAHRIHRDSRTGLVDRGRLREILAESVADLPEGDPRRDPDLAAKLVEATGLLVERGQSLYGFLHLTVAEYLAGRRLTCADHIDPSSAARGSAAGHRDARARIRDVHAHLGDPRWVEPLRLGLGHLSRSAPADFDALVRGLLEGDHASDGLELFGGALDDVAAVTPDQVRAAVEAALAGGSAAAHPAATGAAAAGALPAPAALLLPVLSAPVAPGEERPATTAARALAAALGSESTGRVDAAARLVEALPVTDRGVAQALFDAQYADGSHRGWHTVRALHALLGRWEGAQPTVPDASGAGDPDGADPIARLVAEHGADWRRRLDGVELRRAPAASAAPAAARGLRGGILSARAAPMRAALQRRGGTALLEWALVRPAWARLLICLYGGLPLNDAAALRDERDRLLDVLRSGEDTATDRRLAAVRLDTVVAPALARAAQTAFTAADVSADSPLTTRVLEWLAGRQPEDAVARHLAAFAADTAQSAQARGDALAAHLVMTGALGTDGIPELGADPAVAARAGWRLDRAWLLLRGAAAAIRPHPIVRALARPVPSPATAWASQWLRSVTLTTSTQEPQPFDDDPDLAGQPLSALLRAVCVDSDGHRAHRAAVIIDTAGGRIGADDLARACATVHRFGANATEDWPFDPLVPEPEEHRLLGAALGNLALLAPRWAFLRCWALRRLAVPLGAAGLSAEAAALAWRDRVADPAGSRRALTALLPALAGSEGPPPGPEEGSGALLRFLTRALDGVPDPYDRARARIALAAAERRRLAPREITDLTAAIADPHERLRAGEYAVALGTAADGDPGPADLPTALAADAREIADPALAAAARERLGRLEHGTLGAAGPVLRALTEVTGSPATGIDSDSAAVHDLVGAVCGNPVEHADRPFNVAVALDTSGASIVRNRGIGLARGLAEAHRVPAPASADWPLDPNGPTTGLVLPEALTNLAALKPRWAFLRCWALDRLAPDLVADGYGPEAVCLALRDLPADRDSAVRTAGRLLARLEAADARSPAPIAVSALFARLGELVAGIGAPYPRARALLHLAALRGAAEFDPVELPDLMASVPEATDRVRLAELAMALRLARPYPRLLRLALAETERMADKAERAQAVLRLTAVLGDGEGDHGGEVAGDAAPAAGTAEDTPLSAPLFKLERERGEQQADTAFGPPLAWAVLTAAAYCADALPRLLDAADPADARAQWERAARPASADDRAAAVRTLLAAGERRPHALGPAAVRALEALVAAGEGDSAASLLAVGRLHERTATAGIPEFVERLRGAADQRVADLATLLALEAGRVDTGTVAALPRLAADSDDRVRLRTCTSLAVVSRGGSGPPRFSATRLGAPVLASLAALGAQARRTAPALATEVGWMLSDIEHDSPTVLKAALDGLDAPARAEILTRFHTMRADFLDSLADHLLGLPPEDQLYVLRGLTSAVAYPARFGLAEERIADVVSAVRQVAAEADDAAFAETLRVLGFALPATAESAEELLGELALCEDGHADRAVGEAACHAIGVLVRRIPEGLASVPAVRTALDRVARSGAPELAAAAVGALVRGGDPVEDRVGEIAPATVVRGLLAAVDTLVVGPVYDAEIRRVADFVGTPPDLADADGRYHTRSLIAALLEWAARGIESEPGDSRAGLGRSASDILAVLAVLAARQAAALREAAAAHPRDVPALLRDHLVRADDWVGRQSAAQILACLGRGDAATLAAVLAAATDTDIVRRRVLARLAWFDSVEPGALDLLCAAVEDASLARAQFAVQILAALVASGVLDADQRRRAVEALRAAARRPDGYRRMVREYDGRMVVAQPFAELCGAVLRGLGAPVAAGAEAARDEAVSRILMDTPAGNRVSVEVGEGALPVDPYRYQHEWWRDVGRDWAAAEAGTALEELCQKAHEGGVAVTALLAAVLAAAEEQAWQ